MKEIHVFRKTNILSSSWVIFVNRVWSTLMKLNGGKGKKERIDKKKLT